MKIRSVAEDLIEVTVNLDAILFNYDKPVAARIQGALYRVEPKPSDVITQNIDQWLGGMSAEIKPQSFFDELASI